MCSVEYIYSQPIYRQYDKSWTISRFMSRVIIYLGFMLP